MSNSHRIEGIAAPLDIANLDTDQIMPKQFLRGIDKKGLDKGLLWDLRFDREGQMRPDFVLNRTEFVYTKFLVAGPNFGCGSSREHAVWGLQQYGIRAVIASSFGEIFYSNAMNNGLLAIKLPEQQAAELLKEISQGKDPLQLVIDLESMEVCTPTNRFPFELSERNRKMFLEGVDMIGASLADKEEILAFASSHWSRQPWVQDVAARTEQRMDQS